MKGKMKMAVAFAAAMMAMSSVTAFADDATGNSTTDEVWTYRAVADVTSAVNIRAAASEDSQVVGTLSTAASADIIERGEEWSHIISGGVEGYVKSEYLAFESDAAYLASVYGTAGVKTYWDGVNLFAEPSGSSAILTTVDAGAEYEVLSNDGSWICVQMDDATVAYVPAEDVENTTILEKAVPMDSNGSTYGSSSSESATDTSYSDSYTDGSYDTTYSDGYTDGSSDTSYSDGYTDGSYDTSYSDSYTDSSSDTSYSDGYTDGGYDTSYSDSYTDSSSDTSYSDGYTDGSYDTSYSDSYTDGSYDTSYSDGYTDGSSDTGYSEDYTDSSSDGSYDTSYSDGSTDGSYDTSYSEDYTDSSTDTSYSDGSTDTSYEDTSSSSSAGTSSSDLDLLAGLIYCEAGNQSREGKVAVGAVVMNRVASGSFADSISGVIYQSGQFTPAGSGWLDSVIASGSIPSDCYEAAQAALNGENPVGDALYFNTGSGQGIQIGAHQFY